MQDLKLSELLDNPPPGVDEAVAISQVIRLMKNPDYAQFRCVVFDTAPTGHTLRLLTLPDFLNTGVGKIVRLRFTIANALSGITNFFSGKSGQTVDKAVEKLELLQVYSHDCVQLAVKAPFFFLSLAFSALCYHFFVPCARPKTVQPR